MNKILYPIFLKFLPFSKSEKWKIILKELACGRFPHNVMFNNNMILAKNGNNIVTYNIEPDNINKKSLKYIKKLLKPKILNLDKKDNKKLILGKNWSKIRNKNIRKRLLIFYLIKVKNKLNNKEEKNLLSFFNTSLLLNTINKDNIILKNNRIDVIKNLNIKNPF